MLDVITFGSATVDVFLRCPNIEIKKFNNQNYLQLNEKTSVEGLEIYTGGSATNTAATFANLGLKTKVICAVGDDEHGRLVKRDLLDRGIKISGVQTITNAQTNYATVLSTGNQNRAILIYRDASKKLNHRDINWKNIDAKIFFIGTLSNVETVLAKAIFTAKQKKAIIALNPGYATIQKGVTGIKDYLNETDYLFLNKKEAELLTGGSLLSEKKIFEKIKAQTKGLVIITNGPKGVKIFDGKKILSAKPYDAKHIDATGAGDAFASGFTGMMLKTDNDLKKSLDFALKNSSYVITKLGAKNGLIKG